MILRCWAWLGISILTQVTGAAADVATNDGRCPDAHVLLQRGAGAAARRDAPAFGASALEVTRGSSSSSVPTIEVSFVSQCSGGEWITGTYNLQGLLSTGSPWYKSDEAGGTMYSSMYLYHDNSCDGQTNTPRWIIDSDAPDPSQASDMDQDETCQYWARYDSPDYLPPTDTQTVWKVFCGSAWRDVLVYMVEPTTSTTTASTTATSAATTITGIMTTTMIVMPTMTTTPTMTLVTTTATTTATTTTTTTATITVATHCEV
mmetsp:Transcript_125677/g.367157  ORF Transcript_125677/g.367157 Transcript_125677/m.367157 type:complete len:261 (-) Transcript_125677:3418-4200(-)